MNECKPDWFKYLSKCSETLYIVDDDTKEIQWTNNPGAKIGDKCYETFFHKNFPCEVCPKLKKNQFYNWDYYDSNKKSWLSIKNYLFDDNGKLLRAGNMNKMNDAMDLSYESVEQISSLQRLLTENKAIKNKMEEEALHDRMTGLLNRNCFNLDIASFKFLKPNVGILYFDLNNLKEVNDKYRHEAGDQLIILLAKSIQQTSLGFPDSFAYRIGGDEFILILMNCTETMLKDAQKLFETYLSKNQTSLFCDVAIGVAFSSNMCDIEKLVSLADQNMYKVKRQMKALRMEELCH